MPNTGSSAFSASLVAMLSRRSRGLSASAAASPPFAPSAMRWLPTRMSTFDV
jgi:hypothetical protein